MAADNTQQGGIVAPQQPAYTPKRGFVFTEGVIQQGQVHWDYKEPSMFEYITAGISSAAEGFKSMFDNLQKVRIKRLEDVTADKTEQLYAAASTLRAAIDAGVDINDIVLPRSGRTR